MQKFKHDFVLSHWKIYRRRTFIFRTTTPGW